MEFRKAVQNDAERIMELINEAKQFLRESGVDQWQTGYPDMAAIEADIESQDGYVLEDDGCVIAYFYTTCGIVCFDNSDKVAYEKVLK